LASFAFRNRDREAGTFIEDCLQQAHGERQQYEPQWHENWSNYRVESSYGLSAGGTDKRYPMADPGLTQARISPINFLKTPESHQGVNTLRALLLAGLFGTRDYVQADPVGDEDVESAKRVSRLVMYGLERPGNFRTNFEMLGDALIFGLGSYTARWRNEVRLVPRRVPVPDPTNPGQFLMNPETERPMTVLQNVKVPVHDDPMLESDELWDTWFDPSANRFDQLGWKIKRFKIRDVELKALQQDENWDEEGIQLALESEPSGPATGPDASDRPKLLTENLTQEDVKDVGKFGYYGGWMFEGTAPPDVAKALDLDPMGTVVIRMVNGTVIQAVQSPQRNGEIQGGTITILPTGRGIYGLSPLTVVRYLQDVGDTQLILTTQALIEAVYQNYVIGGDLGPNFKHDLETRRPREVLQIQTGDVEQIKPLERDYTGVQVAVGALQLISQTMRNAMNARDPVQGVFNQSGDTTATESQLVTASALQNTDQLAVLIERDELPVMGRLINDLYYINLDDEDKVFRRVGETETTAVSYFDIDAVTDINFVGARSLLSKAGMANQFRDFANMLASNPFTAAAVDWHEFVRRYGDEVLSVKGLERLMLTDPEEIVARMQAMGLANVAGQSVRGGGAGASGGAPAKKNRRNAGTGGRTGGATASQTAGEAN